MGKESVIVEILLVDDKLDVGRIPGAAMGGSGVQETSHYRMVNSSVLYMEGKACVGKSIGSVLAEEKITPFDKTDNPQSVG